MRIRIRERRAARAGDPQMRQLALAAGQPPANLPQRMRVADVAEQHGDKLPPTREASRVSLRACRHYRPLKLGAWKKLEQLIEDAAESHHRGGLLMDGDRVASSDRRPSCGRSPLS